MTICPGLKKRRLPLALHDLSPSQSEALCADGIVNLVDMSQEGEQPAWVVRLAAGTGIAVYS